MEMKLLKERRRKTRSIRSRGMAEFRGRPFKTWTFSIDARPHTRSRCNMTIGHLPTEVLTAIFTGIPIRDLLAVRQVCKLFHRVTDIPSVWRQANFSAASPSTNENLQIFVKAASYDNFEAAIKLAVARLYNDGLPKDQKRMSITANSEQAADYFYQAQRLAPASPFIWLLLRPPWAHAAISLKGCTSQKLLESCRYDSHGALTMSMAHLLQLIERPAEANEFTVRAASLGCVEAMTLTWKYKYGKDLASVPLVDMARELEAMRELRALASSSDRFSQLLLATYYASGRYGGISPQQAHAFTKHVFQSSVPLNILPYMTAPHRVTASIRYILIDWMADVASMPTLALHHHALLCAVDIVDRCIMARHFTLGNLQLLGVAALVITSRYMSENILTVTNAVASTASTWTYSEVVQMIGEVIAILKGRIRGVTSLDYVGVLERTTVMDERLRQTIYFILALCMLQPSLTIYSHAHLASCAVLLACCLNNYEAWPARFQEVTGFSLKDLIPCTFAIHHKCLLEDMQYDPNGIAMKGVRLRFNDENSPFDMGLLKIPSYKELQERLGVARPVVPRSKLRVYHVQDLICSPSRGKQTPARCPEVERPCREDTATPPLDHDTSGYHGDCEDDTDPFDLSESFSSTQSDDTDPYGEAAADADFPHFNPSNSSKKKHTIAISSSQGIMINISNPNFSLSTSGSPADTYSSCVPSSSGIGSAQSNSCSDSRSSCVPSSSGIGSAQSNSSRNSCVPSSSGIGSAQSNSSRSSCVPSSSGIGSAQSNSSRSSCVPSSSGIGSAQSNSCSDSRSSCVPSSSGIGSAQSNSSRSICVPSSSGIGSAQSNSYSVSSSRQCCRDTGVQGVEDKNDIEEVCCEVPHAAVALPCSQQGGAVGGTRVSSDAKTHSDEKRPSVGEQVSLPYPVMESSASQSDNRRCSARLGRVPAGREVSRCSRENVYDSYCGLDTQGRDQTQVGFRPVVPHQQNNDRGASQSNIAACSGMRWRGRGISENSSVCPATVQSPAHCSSTQHTTPTEGNPTAVGKAGQSTDLPDVAQHGESFSPAAVGADRIVQRGPLARCDQDLVTERGNVGWGGGDVWHEHDGAARTGSVASTSKDVSCIESPITFGFPIAESSPLKTVRNRPRLRQKSSCSSTCVSLLFSQCTSDPVEVEGERSPDDAKSTPRRKRSCNTKHSSSSPEAVSPEEKKTSSPSPAKRMTLKVPTQVSSPGAAHEHKQ